MAPVVPAIAKDVVPGSKPKPTYVCPSPASTPTFNKEVGKILSSMAATFCGLAVSRGSYAIGIVCGLIVAKLDRTTGNSDIVAVAPRSNTKAISKFTKIVNSEFDTKRKINPKAY